MTNAKLRWLKKWTGPKRKRDDRNGKRKKGKAKRETKKKQKIFTIVFKPNVKDILLDPGEPVLDGKYRQLNLLVMGEGTYKRVNGNTEGKAIMQINERKHGLSEKLMSKISEDSKLVENKGIPKKDLKKLE